MATKFNISPALGDGIYTVKDASDILNISSSKMRSWLKERDSTPSFLPSWGEGKKRGFNFKVLIEVFVIHSLRKLGATLAKIKSAHEQLSDLLKTEYPFANKGIFTDTNSILFDLETFNSRDLLNLNQQQQMEFKDLVEPFCHNIDFSEDGAERYWPNGRDGHIVVDPRHSFGRPSITGTNITTEVISSLIEAGEETEDVADQFEVSVEAVIAAYDYEHRTAA